MNLILVDLCCSLATLLNKIRYNYEFRSVAKTRQVIVSSFEFSICYFPCARYSVHGSFHHSLGSGVFYMRVECCITVTKITTATIFFLVIIWLSVENDEKGNDTKSKTRIIIIIWLLDFVMCVCYDDTAASQVECMRAWWLRELHHFYQRERVFFCFTKFIAFPTWFEKQKLFNG